MSTISPFRDIPDMRMVLLEVWELVEDGLITRDDIRDFTFANAVHLFGTQNPDFFDGTPVGDAAARRCSAKPRFAPPRNSNPLLVPKTAISEEAAISAWVPRRPYACTEACHFAEERVPHVDRISCVWSLDKI